eukprot:TRINITY_DN5228_c0_g1_i1.p1 TRINITY_DN5228_c0_g1~~TRINITY_DN5228_c0_g1_i1.p1  ORF type:complete len:690 (+),score=95.02 TRINITY_DN5228_c0_g1_i1:123-2192(+)
MNEGPCAGGETGVLLRRVVAWELATPEAASAVAVPGAVKRLCAIAAGLPSEAQAEWGAQVLRDVACDSGVDADILFRNAARRWESARDAALALARVLCDARLVHGVPPAAPADGAGALLESCKHCSAHAMTGHELAASAVHMARQATAVATAGGGGAVRSATAALRVVLNKTAWLAVGNGGDAGPETPGALPPWVPRDLAAFTDAVVATCDAVEAYAAVQGVADDGGLVLHTAWLLREVAGGRGDGNLLLDALAAHANIQAVVAFLVRALAGGPTRCPARVAIEALLRAGASPLRAAVGRPATAPAVIAAMCDPAARAHARIDGETLHNTLVWAAGALKQEVCDERWLEEVLAHCLDLAAGCRGEAGEDALWLAVAELLTRADSLRADVYSLLFLDACADEGGAALPSFLLGPRCPRTLAPSAAAPSTPYLGLGPLCVAAWLARRLPSFALKAAADGDLVAVLTGVVAPPPLPPGSTVTASAAADAAAAGHAGVAEYTAWVRVAAASVLVGCASQREGHAAVFATPWEHRWAQQPQVPPPPPGSWAAAAAARVLGELCGDTGPAVALQTLAATPSVPQNVFLATCTASEAEAAAHAEALRRHPAGVLAAHRRQGAAPPPRTPSPDDMDPAEDSSARLPRKWRAMLRAAAPASAPDQHPVRRAAQLVELVVLVAAAWCVLEEVFWSRAGQ